MSFYHRVVWSEGLPLDQHHFQQWDRFNQKLVQDRLRALTSYGST